MQISKIKDETITTINGRFVQPTRLLVYLVVCDGKDKIFNFYIPGMKAMENEGCDFEEAADQAIQHYITTGKIKLANIFDLPFINNGNGFIV